MSEWDVLFQSLCLLMPVLAANQGAHLTRLCRLPDVTTNKWLFGKNKTLMPFLIGPALSMFVLVFFLDQNFFSDGLVLGLGAVAGDHVKSAIKHSRWVDIKPGDPWFLDRIDFAIGGALAAKFHFWWVTWDHVLSVVAMAYPIHLIGNAISYHLNWRKTPH